MTTKSATILVRIEPQIKKQAESVFDDLGVSPSTAVNMFYRQVIKHDGLPFRVTKKKADIPDLDKMTKDEIKELLDLSEIEIKSGKTTSAEKVFKDLHEEFDI